MGKKNRSTLGALQAIITASAVLAAVGVVALAGLHMLRADAAQQIYKDRLIELGETYTSVVEQYNTAVRQSTVTELVVEPAAGQTGPLTLAVVVRDAAGERKRIETPYDPSGEIYIDFVVLDGRVWIRRVFDDRTPPSEAVVIDPAVADVQWSMDGSGYGKAVYRSLTEGRWAVSISGNGSLTLAPVTGPTPPDLVHPPEIVDFEAIVREADASAQEVRLSDVLRNFLGLETP